jgi:hypothetical protein
LIKSSSGLTNRLQEKTDLFRNAGLIRAFAWAKQDDSVAFNPGYHAGKLISGIVTTQLYGPKSNGH